MIFRFEIANIKTKQKERFSIRNCFYEKSFHFHFLCESLTFNWTISGRFWRSSCLYRRFWRKVFGRDCQLGRGLRHRGHPRRLHQRRDLQRLDRYNYERKLNQILYLKSSPKTKLNVNLFCFVILFSSVFHKPNA